MRIFLAFPISVAAYLAAGVALAFARLGQMLSELAREVAGTGRG